MRNKQLLPIMSLPLVASLAACADPLPDPQLVIGPRVLAVQTEVTTPLPFIEEEEGAAPRAQALPFEGVTLTAYLVDENGPYAPDEIEPVWIACEMSPGQGLFGCISESFPLELDDIPACPVTDPFTLDVENPPPTVSPCLVGREFAPEFSVPFSPNLFVGGDLEITMIAGPPGGTTTDTCAREILAGESQLPNDCLYAVQRLSLGPVEAIGLLLAEFGVEIEGIEVPAQDEVPDPDRNPRIEKIETIIQSPDGSQTERTEVQDGDTVTVRQGDTIRVYTTSPESDLQTYEIEVNNGESTQEEQEAYFGDWYITWGQLLSSSSDDPESFNEVTLEQGSQDEDETPPNDEGHIYYVLTDGRQGVNWWHLRLDIQPPE